MVTTKQRRVLLERENRNYSDTLIEVPRNRWPACPPGWTIPTSVWRNRRFLVQVFREPNEMMQISVNRTELEPGGERWKDGITWDELQGLKRDLGWGDWYAVEVFPRDCDVVNVSNMRHLWILPKPLEIGWFHA